MWYVLLDPVVEDHCWLCFHSFIHSLTHSLFHSLTCHDYIIYIIQIHTLIHLQALLKIVKHCHESLPQMVTGSLLGLVVKEGVLEITHAFPFPEPLPRGGGGAAVGVVEYKDEPTDDAMDDVGALEGHEFQLEMMRMLREVNVDNNCVGWYQSMYLGSYSTSSFLENHMESFT